MLKGVIGVLKSSVAVKDGMGIGIFCDGLSECVKDERIVITVADNIGNNASVIQVQYGAEIEFVDDRSFIPFELCYICEPYLIRSVCMKMLS